MALDGSEHGRHDGDLGDALAGMLPQHDESRHDDPAVATHHTLVEVLAEKTDLDDVTETARLVIDGLDDYGYVVVRRDAVRAPARRDDQASRPGAEHYAAEVQPIDIIDAYDLGFYEGQVIKYVARWERKSPYHDDPLIDLRKARWYLSRLIEREERRRSGQVR